ncbi:MAG: LysR family transcriptional regulator [Erysipelotrichaceae bacterium]|nr:LysR family transcriptional regulator [Erysipelotrichaceae bacterium]
MLDPKLETFITVAELKNFTKAAQALNLTQPAVSNHINQLEKEYNTKLFMRKKKDFTLTNEGKIALTYARRLKALHEKMIQKIADEQTSSSHIKIGITHTSENNNITEVLAQYANQMHNITITIITDSINNLYDMLENYQLDIAIVDGKKQSGKLNYLMLDTDYLVCVLSSQHPLAKNSSISLNQLKKENMILRLPSSSTRSLFEATLISINESIDSFNVLLEVDNVSTIKQLVMNNFGVSILPQSVCTKDVKKGKIKTLPIENLSMTRQMNIAYNKDFANIDVLNDIVTLYRTSQNK